MIFPRILRWLLDVHPLPELQRLVQEAGLETVLSAASSLKHAASMRKTYTTRQQAQERTSQLLPKGSSVEECVRETPGGRFTLCVN